MIPPYLDKVVQPNVRLAHGETMPEDSYHCSACRTLTPGTGIYSVLQLMLCEPCWIGIYRMYEETFGVSPDGY
jgi:hypothetical protein